MIQANTLVRVRYGETDQMGYVYYGNYALYYEIGRTELLRSLGLTYRALEESGVMLPVLNLTSKYIAPARYDDVLKVVTTIPEIPKSSRIMFNYEIYNQQEQLLNKGMTELVFVNMNRNKPCVPPKEIIEKLKNAFEAKD